jgi:hypothetical protein
MQILKDLASSVRPLESTFGRRDGSVDSKGVASDIIGRESQSLSAADSAVYNLISSLHSNPKVNFRQGKLCKGEEIVNKGALSLRREAVYTCYKKT